VLIHKLDRILEATIPPRVAPVASPAAETPPPAEAPTANIRGPGRVPPTAAPAQNDPYADTQTWTPQPQQPQSDPYANTQSWVAPSPATMGGAQTPATMQAPAPGSDRKLAPGEMGDAMRMVDQIRSDHYTNMPVQQKIDTALKKAMDGEKIAYRALRDVDLVGRKLDAAVKDINAKIQQVEGGKTMVDPPGSSIFDDDEEDPESIFGR
jgi:hypothetical protein